MSSEEIKRIPSFDFIEEAYERDKIRHILARMMVRSAELRLALPKDTLANDKLEEINIDDLKAAVSTIRVLVKKSSISGELDNLIQSLHPNVNNSSSNNLQFTL